MPEDKPTKLISNDIKIEIKNIKNIPITSSGGSWNFGAVMSVEQMNKFVGVSTYERFDIWTSSDANYQKIDKELNKIIEDEGIGTVLSYKKE